nr:P11 protein [Hymenolepis microstoma]
MVSTYTRSHTELFAQKLVDMLPRSSMSRAILRTLGIECNGDTPSQGSGALSCLTRAAHNIPGIVKRACSPPSGFFKSHVLDSERSRSYDRSELFPNPILTSVSASQENTPPASKRPLVRSELAVITDLPRETPIGSKRHQSVAFESHVLRPRMSIQPYGGSNNKVVKYSNSPSTSVKSVTNSVRVSNSDSLSSRFIASTRPHYYQPHFDAPRESTSNTGIQKQIEIPSWRINDIISDNYAAEAGLTRVLRTRNFQKKTSHMSPKRRYSTQSDGKYEDLSDEAYLARHARLETEEIKQERLSILRLAEDELRQRLEQRERDSWRRRQSSKLNGYLDDNPDRLMPSQLIDSVDKVQTIRVRDEVPVIAFGVKVPKPKFKSSALL